MSRPEGRASATKKKGSARAGVVQPCQTKSAARVATVANTEDGRMIALTSATAAPERFVHV